MYKFYKILQISQILLSRREKRIFHILFRSENYYFQKISEFVREEFPRILEPSRDETTPLFSRDNRSKEFPSSFPMDRREIFRLPRNETACWNNYLRHRERYIYIRLSLSLFFSNADCERGRGGRGCSVLSARERAVDSFGRFLRNSSLQ